MIRFRYQPTLQDWVAFNRIVVFRQFRTLIVVAVVLFGVYLVQPLALLATGHDEDSVLEIYAKNIGVLWVPGIVCFILGSIRFAVRRRWNKAEEIRDAREYEIDETGIRVTAPSLSGFMEWRLFRQAELRKGFFLLKTGQNQFYYFPESVVPDPSALKELLAGKIRGAKF